MKLSGLLYQENKDHMVVTTLPFSFEGRHTRDVAMYSHQRIRANSKHLTLDLNDTIKESGNLGVQDAFRVADEKLGLLFKNFIIIIIGRQGVMYSTSELQHDKQSIDW